MTQLAKVFELNRQGLNIARGIAIAVVLLLPLVVLGLIHQDQYWLSVSFGALFVGVSDPGGEYAHRVPPMALTGVAGALLTALGFGVGGQAWGFVVLVAFVVTLLGGLAVKFGVHRFAQATLLNVWFIIAITLPMPTALTTSTPTPGRRRWPGSSDRPSGSLSRASCGWRAGGPRSPRLSRRFPGIPHRSS